MNDRQCASIIREIVDTANRYISEPEYESPKWVTLDGRWRSVVFVGIRAESSRITQGGASSLSDLRDFRCHECNRKLAEIEANSTGKVAIKCPKCRMMNVYRVDK